jgi:hypothetical protein
MRVATIAARGGAVIGLLILGAIAIVSPGENDQKTALGAEGKVAPTATSFCAGPAPPSGEIEARRIRSSRTSTGWKRTFTALVLPA